MSTSQHESDAEHHNALPAKRLKSSDDSQQPSQVAIKESAQPCPTYHSETSDPTANSRKGGTNDTGKNETGHTAIPTAMFFSSVASQFSDSKQKFVAPALLPGIGRHAALSAVNRDERNQWTVHFTQTEAFAHCDSQPGSSLRTWGCEISSDGRRRFITASIRAFWRQYSRILRRRPDGIQAHFYEIIREQHAAKLYLDLEFKREFNPQLKGDIANAMTDLVIDQCFRHANIQRDGKEVLVLDSTNEKKFSRHVIFGSLIFHNNLEMGPFMHQVVNKIVQDNPDKMLVYCDLNREADRVPFVDLGVYTRNRCFRLIGSSKFGKTSLLRFATDPPSGIVRVSRAEFYRSLVCNISSSSAPGHDLTKLNLLGQPTRGNGSTYSKTFGTKRVKINNDLVTTPSSPFQLLDEYVMSIVGGCGGGIYSVTVFGNVGHEEKDDQDDRETTRHDDEKLIKGDGRTLCKKENPGSDSARDDKYHNVNNYGGDDIVMYTIKGSYKYCARIGRHHKSNNVILVARLTDRTMFQKCFDPDCKGFRSPPWPIPQWVFIGKHTEDIALVNCLDEVELATAVDGGVSDELLLKAGECAQDYVGCAGMVAKPGNTK